MWRLLLPVLAVLAGCGPDPVEPAVGVVLSPDTGRYGQLVVIEGEDVPDSATVFFTSVSGGRTEAFIHAVGPGRMEVWVPTRAATGPVELVGASDTVVTPDPFTLTADDDIYSGGGPARVSFPLVNPSLVATAGVPDELRFTVPEGGPFSVQLVDRGDLSGETTLRAWLFRLETDPATLLAFTLTLEQRDRPTRLDSVAYSRTQLPAGDYALLVSALDLTGADDPTVRRPYGIRLAAVEQWSQGPDAHEPNDYPAEAAPVQLPFQGSAGVENPFAMDHFAFDVAAAGTATVTVTAAAPGLLVYLLPDGPQDILAAWEADQVLAEADGSDATQQLQAAVSPGRYTALVWDWSGHAGSYQLDIAVTAGLTAPAEAGAAGNGAATPTPGAVREAVSLPAGWDRPGRSRAPRASADPRGEG